MSEFPECVARFPFHSGGWGLMVCLLDDAPAFATVRNRPQPSATVRNHSPPFAIVRRRSSEVPMAVPMGSAAKVVTFEGFKRCAASFFLWQAWHFVLFQHVS